MGFSSISTVLTHWWWWWCCMWLMSLCCHRLLWGSITHNPLCLVSGGLIIFLVSESSCVCRPVPLPRQEHAHCCFIDIINPVIDHHILCDCCSVLTCVVHMSPHGDGGTLDRCDLSPRFRCFCGNSCLPGHYWLCGSVSSSKFTLLLFFSFPPQM